MIANLDVQLENFKEDIKRKPEQVKVVKREGYSGGGAISLFEVLVMLLVLLVAMAKNKSNNANSANRNQAGDLINELVIK